MDNMEIAQKILKTLDTAIIEGYGSGKMAMMAWGAEKFISSNGPDAYGMGWMRFKVSGGKLFKGWVRVSLTSSNYTVTFENYSNRTGEYTVTNKFENIPADRLVSVIDQVIEG